MGTCEGFVTTWTSSRLIGDKDRVSNRLCCYVPRVFKTWYFSKLFAVYVCKGCCLNFLDTGWSYIRLQVRSSLAAADFTLTLRLLTPAQVACLNATNFNTAISTIISPDLHISPCATIRKHLAIRRWHCRSASNYIWASCMELFFQISVSLGL